MRIVTGARKCVACGSSFDHSNKEKMLCRYCENALERMNGYAIPVVRCKDCRFKTEPGQPNICCCNMKDDDFCSYGERKNNGISNSVK